ncbi:hypothetical protein I6N95_07410 [Vagococcus sp. BWB3-3]|uniref:Uncharacterized protein n=1 Tax=Vagococcus allomyrinae TaxID=2794353 RepID=A0A940SVY8_9ENTE|nr:hypothetical protein [Vagococcus allomyrinae]MBP1040828.1 hypothetical protein [Vagococcus allomyrinae]
MSALVLALAGLDLRAQEMTPHPSFFTLIGLAIIRDWILDKPVNQLLYG